MFGSRLLSSVRTAGTRAFSATPRAAFEDLSFTRVSILGRVASDVRIRELNENRSIVEVTVATSKNRRRGEGEIVRETDWHRVTTFITPQALNYYNRFRKGNVVYLEGSIRYNNFTDKNGNERSITNIVATNIQNYGDYRVRPREQHEHSERAMATEGEGEGEHQREQQPEEEQQQQPEEFEQRQ